MFGARGMKLDSTWSQSVAFRTVLRRFQSIALGSDRLAQIVIIVSVLQEAAELFVLARFLGVRNCEKMILSNEPIAQAAVFGGCE